MVKLRTLQGGSGGDGQLLPTASFTAPQLEMLRHAFELLCTDTTEGQSQGVNREQIAEIMVMAGLEFSAPDTMLIINQLVCPTHMYKLQRKQPYADGYCLKIKYDGSLKIENAAD